MNNWLHTHSFKHHVAYLACRWPHAKLTSDQQDISTAGCERKAGEEMGIAQNIQVGVGLDDFTKISRRIRALGIELM